LIEDAVKPQNYQGPQIELIERNTKVSNDEAIEQIFNLIKTPNTKQEIGFLTSEQGVGAILNEFHSLTKKFTPEAKLKNCSDFIDEILSHKDNEEIENITISSKYSCYIMDYVIKMFENSIDQEISTTHSKLSNDIKNLTEKPIFNNKFKEKEHLQNIDLSLLEIGGLPVVQSGGNYDLNPFSTSDNKKLSSDVIICKVHSRYKDYNSFVIRSFMIDAQNSQQTKYKILFEAFNFLISKLVDGAVLSDVYKQTFDFIVDKDHDIKDNLPENFGFSVGLETQNDTIKIKAGNYKKVSAGMIFYVILSFAELKNEKDFRYSLQIGDTILVKSSSRDILTGTISKNLSEINYDMEDEEEEDLGEIAKMAQNKVSSNGIIENL
jgi:nucleosome binding factor SPN SPT16 subunit